MKKLLLALLVVLMWHCKPRFKGPDGGCARGKPCASSPSGCADFDTDPSNCGGCGKTCGAGEACIAGSCKAACSLPVAGTLALGGSVIGKVPPGIAGTIDKFSCIKPLYGPEQIYSLTIAKRTGVALWVESAFDTTLAVRRECSDINTEIGCDDDAAKLLNARLHLALDPGVYSVIVEHGIGGGSGPFTLHATEYTLAPNGTCATASVLEPGATVTAETSTGQTPPIGTCGKADMGPPQLYYDLTIPPKTVTELRAVSQAGGRATMRLTADCEASTRCAVNGYIMPVRDGVPSVLRTSNGTALPRHLRLAISRPKSNDGPDTYTLSRTDNPLPANAACAGATDLLSAPVIANENAGAASDPYFTAPTCGNGNGHVLYYRAKIPAGETLAVHVTPTGDVAWDPIVRVVDACPPTACIANQNLFAAGEPESLVVPNKTTKPLDVVIAVGSTVADTTGTFDIVGKLVPSTPPTNVSCASAMAMTAGSAVIAQSTVGGGPAPVSACALPGLGRTVFYSINVPAQSMLTVRARPLSGWNLALRAFGGCGATECLATADVGSSGAGEKLDVPNPSSAPISVIVSVSGNSTADGGVFDIAPLIRPLPYVESAIPAACDESVASAQPLEGVTSDDSASPVTLLPFAFDYFGQSVTAFSVNSNGFVQFFPTAQGTTSLRAANDVLPSPSLPNNMAAIFWDDMRPATNGAVRTAVLGGEGARTLVIDWRNWGFGGNDTMNFQMHIKESGVIEYHYCSLTSVQDAARALGNDATVGLENADGSMGVLHSYKRAASVAASQGIRFTPPATAP